MVMVFSVPPAVANHRPDDPDNSSLTSAVPPLSLHLPPPPPSSTSLTSSSSPSQSQFLFSAASLLPLHAPPSLRFRSATRTRYAISTARSESIKASSRSGCTTTKTPSTTAATTNSPATPPSEDPNGIAVSGGENNNNNADDDGVGGGNGLEHHLHHGRENANGLSSSVV
ncbi:unnamed protein product [Microthlaspi erraticum]|uniref:Uncharacterized protein n=1 Tax=Microthlaspi erraticum TaxID=1685480 RepID=A0A6D2JSQ0_9BRAS|nr:unnamed protein product [Microthlaspi erraticum]